MTDDLRGLSGGRKQMWLSENKELVMRYCELFGPEDTCEKFNLEHETLQRLYSKSNRQIPFSKADKAMVMAEISQEAANELRREVQELKKNFGEFQTSVAGQVANKILIPWIQAAIQLSEELELKPGDGPLSLRDLQLPGGDKKGDFRFK